MPARAAWKLCWLTVVAFFYNFFPENFDVSWKKRRSFQWRLKSKMFPSAAFVDIRVAAPDIDQLISQKLLDQQNRVTSFLLRMQLPAGWRKTLVFVTFDVTNWFHLGIGFMVGLANAAKWSFASVYVLLCSPMKFR